MGIRKGWDKAIAGDSADGTGIGTGTNQRYIQALVRIPPNFEEPLGGGNQTPSPLGLKLSGLNLSPNPPFACINHSENGNSDPKLEIWFDSIQVALTDDSVD